MCPYFVCSQPTGWGGQIRWSLVRILRTAVLLQLRYLSKSSPFDCLESKEMKLDPDRNCCQVLIIEDNSYVQSVRRIKSLSHSTNVNNLA